MSIEGPAPKAGVLIPLKTYDPNPQLPPFLGIRCTQPSAEFLTVLTPQVMQWEEDLWLCDLSLCVRFWQSQAAKQGKHPLALCEEALRASGLNYQAVFANHPWQAMFLLTSRRATQPALLTQELISLTGPFGQSLFAAADWSAWFEAAATLGQHLAASKRPRFVLSRFRSQCSQMAKAMQRLGGKGPQSLQAVAEAAMKRRFGAILAEAWQWTFSKRTPALNQQPTGLFKDETQLWQNELASFPWQAWQQPQPVSVKRYLETPLSHWQECQAYLAQDLDRLCQHEGWHAGERVTSLSWQLTFYHLKTTRLVIAFRHPHALHHEQGQHPTALSQAEYAFEAARTELAGRSDDLDLPADMPLIAWELSLEGKMSMPQWLTPLFSLAAASPAEAGDEKSTANDSGLAAEDELAVYGERLLALENKLPVAFDRYYLCPDFDPLAAFDCQNPKPQVGPDLHLWRVAAVKRPLFIYHEPHLMPAQAFSSRRQFLERTPYAWWQQGRPSPGLARDYYLLVDHTQRAHWVFYDEHGSWYKHGIFS